jgi:hypothetical protein
MQYILSEFTWVGRYTLWLKLGWYYYISTSSLKEFKKNIRMKNEKYPIKK